MSPFAEIAAVEAAFANGHAGRVEEAATHYHNDKNLRAQILAKMAEGVAKIMETCRETVDNAWVYFVAADFDTKTALNTHAANWAQMDNLRDEETAAQDARDDRERADRWAVEGVKLSPVVFRHLAAATTTTTTTAAPAAPAAAANPFILRITRATPDRTPDSPTIDAQAALLVDLFAGTEEDEDEEEEEPAVAETAVAVPPVVVPAPAVPAPVAPALPAAMEPVAAAAEEPKRGQKRKMVEELKSELVLEDAPRGKRARKPTVSTYPFFCFLFTTSLFMHDGR